jgi:hypothetical protein
MPASVTAADASGVGVGGTGVGVGGTAVASTTLVGTGVGGPGVAVGPHPTTTNTIANAIQASLSHCFLIIIPPLRETQESIEIVPTAVVFSLGLSVAI